MRLRLFGLLVAMAVCPTSATAAPVVFVTHGGRTVVRNDPFLIGPALTPEPASAAGSARARSGPRGSERTVVSELARMYHRGSLTAGAYRADRATWRGALGAEHSLSGTRRAELTAVTQTLHNIAAAGLLTPSRLPVLFLTLKRNRQYWADPGAALLAFGQRVEFAGSQVVWEYYPGQGIQLQVLGTFGKADGMYTAGPSQYAAMRGLLGEMMPLAAMRGGSLAWEYYFSFDGGVPPWTSAMSQGTAILALTRGYQSLRPNPGELGASYLALAHRALAVFTRRPPTGVGVPTQRGRRYVQYTFAPGADQEIINAFLQSLIGLHAYARASHDPLAAALFAAGDAEAQAELPSFDTGAWSLYQPGQEDDLSYHELVTGFLHQLCAATGTPLYCSTASHFDAYLKTPPNLTILTTHLRVHRPASVSFRLSKISHVGIVVMRGTRTLLSTSASFPYGVHAFAIPTPTHRGQYTIHMSATDLAGNFSRAVGTVALAP